MSDQVRVDRGVIQQHTDDTRANAANLRNAGDEADRQQAHLSRQINGIGQDQTEAVRNASRRHGSDIDTSVNKVNNKTSENADEFISNVRNAANKSIRPI